MAVKLGYTNVYRDPIGFPAWKDEGHPVETASSQPASVTAPEKEYGPVAGWAMLWTLMGIFLGGMALNLTPCVYPLIPITVSYFGGRSSRGRGETFVHGLCYVGGLALTNSSLGVVAAFTGGLMGALLQNPFVLSAVALMLVAFAASMFGFWEFKLPRGLTQAASKSYTGYFGSVFMGITLGVVAAPCIGPFVLGLLTWVAGTGNPYLGFLVFFTLSVGLGLPLFVLALFSGKLDSLPRSGEWMVWVRKLMGWVLVGMAAYFIRPVMSQTMGNVLLAAVALGAGLHLGWIDRSQAGFKAFGWMKTVAGVAGMVTATFLIGSMLMVAPGAFWRPYSDQLLKESAAQKKPVIIDFSAAWCAPCRELDEITFRDPEIVKRSKKDFVLVKVDLTRKGDPVYERLLKQYDVRGVPTVVFIDPDGKERRDLRLVDFLPPGPFLVRMAEISRPPADGPSK